ncbi:hypothetical protein F3Y22_tig00002237pilonHSYRG00654 [Hibiscus syriacus]|uniref:DUF4283 domain-containing protein n=1 Tax=Hibiscus syriacus TaxID=106335 RepID=A0A6A3CT07_HIBSY|nr:hypothetical protein F3Y22_tig00002237pilonHSYRG00654 [Hibiscus syriacus]
MEGTGLAVQGEGFSSEKLSKSIDSLKLFRANKATTLDFNGEGLKDRIKEDSGPNMAKPSFKDMVTRLRGTDGKVNSIPDLDVELLPDNVRIVMDGSILDILFSEQDYQRVLSDGPWMIYECYLTVQPWSRSLSTSEDNPKSILFWVHLPGLPYRYYTKSLFQAISIALGAVVRVDFNTTEGRRGRFARLAIVINLNQPLIHGLMIADTYQGFEYEGLPTICYACGKYGNAKVGYAALATIISEDMHVNKEDNIAVKGKEVSNVEKSMEGHVIVIKEKGDDKAGMDELEGQKQFRQKEVVVVSSKENIEQIQLES